jgi:hypothetical protein
MNKNLRLAALLLAGLATSSLAAITTTPTGTNDPSDFPLTTSNLLLSTVSSGGAPLDWSGDLTLLNDGSLGTTGVSTTYVNGINADTTITFTFDTVSNPNGYNITGIQSYAGWETDAGGRSNQGYAIGLTFVDNTTATLLDKTSWANSDPVDFWTRVVIANSSGNGALDNGSGVVATGVKAITFFGFDEATPKGPVGYREFQIEGTVVPEPAALGLLVGLGGLALRARRRR